MAKKTTKKTKPAAKPAKGQLGRSKEAHELTLRRFVEAYLSHNGNATSAARSVGASAKTAHVMGSRWLSEVKESGLLEQRQQQLLERLSLNTERVLRRLVTLAESDITQFLDKRGAVLPPEEWPAEARGAVQSLKWGKFGPELKLHNAPSALTDAMRHLGLFREDNKQKIDPLVAMLERIAERQKEEGLKPGAYGTRPATTS